MNSFRILQILVIFLIFIAGTADAKRPKDVVKTVGKRFLEKIGVYQRLEFGRLSAEEQHQQIEANTFYIAQWLQAQSSDKNIFWEIAATKLESSMSSDFQGTICQEHKMNYMEYMTYLAKERKNFQKNFAVEDDLRYTTFVTNGTDSFQFMVAFDQKSNFGYNPQAVFVVNLELRGSHENNIYTIAAIDEIGSCPRQGASAWNLAPSILLNLKGNLTEEQEKVRVYVEQLFKVGQPVDEIPFDWILKATAKEQFLKVEICHDSHNGTMPYTKYQLIRWWKKFQLMWHTVSGEANHTRVEYIGGSNGKYVFQVRMRLQIGVNRKADVVETYFKLYMEYNLHGDELWYINKFEVMCPPYSEKKRMEIYAAAISESIGARLTLMAKSEDQWYYVAHLLDPFILNTELDIQICFDLEGEKMKAAKDLMDMDYTFWMTNKNSSMKMLGYKLPGNLDMPAVDTKMELEIKIRWGPEEPDMMHYSVWKFNVEWDSFLQFYHLTGVVFACPITGPGKINWGKSQEECRTSFCRYYLRHY